MLAPICLFTYNRLSKTEQTVEALKLNHLASESDLFIFSDGPKNEENKLKVEAVRQYLHSITGFKKVNIIESTHNKGLANSIISGVAQIIEKFSKVIVLEDDLITSENFLNFMNQALDFYENNPKIHSISGYTFNLNSLAQYTKDYYLAYRASSWGWGTWERNWTSVDWKAKSYSKFKWNLVQQLKFMSGGSDLTRLLRRQMHGKIDSWAILWCFDEFLKKQMTIYPAISKVKNIGIGEESTHTKKAKYYTIILDRSNQTNFTFDSSNDIDKVILQEFKDRFSIINRIRNKFSL